MLSSIRIVARVSRHRFSGDSAGIIWQLPHDTAIVCMGGAEKSHQPIHACTRTPPGLRIKTRTRTLETHVAEQ